ncbi:MAG: fibronectin type III domain-containing protein, partial [Bacteroidota bacterium]|nr:fibronectin type III domain-containing protein [Bacteroidota bacterium]
EDGFSIERWNGSSYVQIATVGSNVTTYTNTGLAYNSQYSYRVAAFNSAGSSGYSNTASATTAQLTAPVAPSGLQTTSVSSTSVALSWTDNATNEDNYEVRRSTDGGVSWSTLTASLPANSTTYSDNSVSAGNTYHYQVFATNAGGSTGSNTISVSTPAASNDITIASIGTNAVSDKNTWQAQFTVTIVDGSNAPVSGANVTGAFSDGYSGSATLTTDGNGQCTFNSPFIHKKNSNVTLTVTNVTHGTLSWDQVQQSASVGKP